MATSPLPHHLVRRSAMPASRAPFEEIVAFAYSYDAYALHGMERCAALANDALSAFVRERVLPNDMGSLRACLFFEARRWIVLEREPDTRARLYVDALLERIADLAEALAADAEPLPLAPGPLR